MEKEITNRKATYELKRQELSKNCEKCTMSGIERCNECTIGKRLRWLEAEYADVTGWGHEQGKW